MGGGARRGDVRAAVLRATLSGGRWRCELWEESAGRLPSQDASAVVLRGDDLRVVVADGCTPARETLATAGVDGAAWAAGASAAIVRAHADLAAGARAANTLLHDPLVAPHRRQQAALVAADFAAAGRVQLVRAADCEAWALRSGRWRRLFPRDQLAPAARTAYRRWLEQHPQRTLEQLLAAEGVLLGERRTWLTAPLGRFPEPTLQAAAVDAWDAVVLASDGARLTPRRLARLDEWLGELRSSERRGAGRGAHHDDVTVVRVWRPG